NEGAAGAVAAQVDAAGIDVLLLCEVVGRGNDIIHLAEEALLDARVVVAATERGEHHDDPGLAEGAGGLVVTRGAFLPASLVDGVAVPTGDPDDGGVLFPVIR